MFKEYKFGAWKKEIRRLLTERLAVKDRINYHKKKIIYHRDKIKIIEDKTLVEIENKLDGYLKRAGNKIN
ncbi:hypothetical protein LCGC14_1406350 [marine sediment metagenome]|uniref:Uncharacterized protein n=1 Tax=marine sediment metagenome TaxID=412755 RepID=A0A0F9JVM1_9ZZZZ